MQTCTEGAWSGMPVIIVIIHSYRRDIAGLALIKLIK